MTPLGLLYASESLDREEVATHQFHVIASDGRLSADVPVTVNVIDQNDNPPIFQQYIGVYSINEGKKNQHVFQVKILRNS